MKPSVQTLGQILYSPSQYVIPVFQRNYRWEAPQWAKLWDSLVEIHRPDKRGNHFMGFLVFVPGLPQPGQHTTFHLIDGQQRLATSSILLAAARNVARRDGQSDLADEIHQYYLVHPLKKGDQHYRLLPKERDHDSYLALVDGVDSPTGRIADALGYFEERLSTLLAGSPESLRDVFDTVCQRLEFMCATLEAENAYNIFKSLNSTGIPLGPSDLIRNFVFMHVPPDEHDDFDADLWGPLEDRFTTADGTLDEERFDRFFRDFLMSTGRYVPPRETFPNFEARYEATGFSPRALARDLIDASRNYSIISGREPDSNNSVTNAFSGLNLLESSTTYPLLLSLVERRAMNVIDAAQLGRAVEMLRGFILRRFVCGESSRGYGQMFVRAIAKEQGDPITALETYLLERGWPDDRQFESAFVELPLYERGYTREVLETLERAREHKEPADLKAAQVEHIMPQTLSKAWRDGLGPDADLIHDEWLQRPGNLTLSAYNPELGNHAFDLKKKRYADSHIVITRELSSYAQWTQKEMRDRGTALAKEAAQIWVGPKERMTKPPSNTGGDAEHDGNRDLRWRFWDGLRKFLVAAHPNLPQAEAWPYSTIRLSSGIRHIGVQLRFSQRPSHVGVEIWFWRDASYPIWEKIRASPAAYNDLFAETLNFDRHATLHRAQMFVDHAVEDVRDKSSWSELYLWLGSTLSLVYEKVIPLLRAEMDHGETTS